MDEITCEGMDEVRRMLGRDLTAALKKASFAIGEQVRGKIAVYPPKRPPATKGRWYQRGYGPRWRRKDGSIGGRKTSEQLGQRWTTRQKGTGAVVGNAASYSPFVQSDEKQATVHRAAGWMTDKKAVEAVQSSGVVEKMCVDAVLHAMGIR